MLTGRCLVIILILSIFTHSLLAVPYLHVSGNRIVDENGSTVRLRGVNRAGSEYACVQGWGFFDGPTSYDSLNYIRNWGVNLIRVPLNEDCWLNLNGVNPAYSGTNYQNAIRTWVNTILGSGMNVILELHWAAPGSQMATGQLPMPNKDHSYTFWDSVANAYKNDTRVIFELYNEPYPDNNNWDSTAGWTCWRDGGWCNGFSYEAAGMQGLVTTVRNTGATNVILLGGLAYSNSLAQWLQYKPYDPTGNLGAAWHSYNFNYCNAQWCWDSYIKPVAQTVPVVATEIGENDCNHQYIDALMSYMDGLGMNYLGWTWNTWDCASGPALISDYYGTATNFGIGFKNHLSLQQEQEPEQNPISVQ